MLEDTINVRADIYRHVAERQLYYVVVWGVTAALVSWILGWWALIPGALAVRSLLRCILNLAREEKVRRED